MKKSNQASLKGSLYSKVARQIFRYHPHDERPAPHRDMTIGGPMLRLAIEHGTRGWLFIHSCHGAPVSMGTISDLVSAGAFDNCIAYVDFKITDDDSSDERFCLWKLCGGGFPLSF